MGSGSVEANMSATDVIVLVFFVHLDCLFILDGFNFQELYSVQGGQTLTPLSRLLFP